MAIYTLNVQVFGFLIPDRFSNLSGLTGIFSIFSKSEKLNVWSIYSTPLGLRIISEI